MPTLTSDKASSIGSLQILPPELRNKIYGYLLPATLTVGYRDCYKTTVRLELGHDGPDLVTLQSLHDLHHEALQAIFFETTFRWETQFGHEIVYEHPVAKRSVNLIQNVEFDVTMECNKSPITVLVEGIAEETQRSELLVKCYLNRFSGNGTPREKFVLRLHQEIDMYYDWAIEVPTGAWSLYRNLPFLLALENMTGFKTVEIIVHFDLNIGPSLTGTTAKHLKSRIVQQMDHFSAALQGQLDLQKLGPAVFSNHDILTGTWVLERCLVFYPAKHIGIGV